MTTTARTAAADQLHATTRDARDCDAINPCKSCRKMSAEVQAARREARVAALSVRAGIVPVPRVEFDARLRAASERIGA